MKESMSGRVWRQLKANKTALAGFIVIIILLLIAICAPMLANDKPYIYISKDKTYFPVFYDYAELRNKDLRTDEFKGFKLFPQIRL